MRSLASVAGLFSRLLRASPMLLCGFLPACASSDAPVHALSSGVESVSEELGPLGEAIGSSRIVLLGENGHGVGEFTEAKARLVEWLHREHGFDVVVFESGFFECGHVWRRIQGLSARDALLQCLRYPFQHAELLPLFELIRRHSSSRHPLALAGMDIQAQGFDSGDRPDLLYQLLRRTAPALARRLAVVDTALFLLPDTGGRGDSVYQWAHANQALAKATYASAAAVTHGWAEWVFRLAEARVDRLVLRADAEARGVEVPGRYYELRDEWMARAVSALADSTAGSRKVVVWLHNDHARYGDYSYGSYTSRSLGGYLREWYGEDVFSVGFFMGRGRIADNGRREHAVAPLPPNAIERFLGDGAPTAGFVLLRGNSDPAVRGWARREWPYLRMGLEESALVPAEEFDALFYVESVTPPDYLR